MDKKIGETFLATQRLRSVVLLVTLDTRKAFKSARLDVIIDAIEKKFCTLLYLLRMVRCYLGDRSLIYDTDSTKSWQGWFCSWRARPKSFTPRRRIPCCRPGREFRPKSVKYLELHLDYDSIDSNDMRQGCEANFASQRTDGRHRRTEAQ